MDMRNQHELKKHMEELNNKGYTVVRGYLNNEEIKIIKTMTDRLSEEDSTVKYRDRNNALRRIEKIVNICTENETIIMDKLRKMTEQITGEKLNIFKDKINLKPPGGEGFSAHYDGIFEFQKNFGKKEKGWYIYCEWFINAVIFIDENTQESGPLEIAYEHKGNFSELIKNTKRDGSPNLKADIEKRCNFEVLNTNAGDIAIFTNRCPHRSRVNMSNKIRRNLYLTFNKYEDGDHYNRYFNDKKYSTNKYKSLVGEINK